MSRVRLAFALLVLAACGREPTRSSAPPLKLSEFAERVTRDPTARKVLFDRVRPGGWLEPRWARAADEALRNADKSALDRFPTLTLAEMRQVAAKFAEEAAPEALPKRDADVLLLAGDPKEPPKGRYLKKLGFGVWYGEFPVRGLPSAYGDNAEVAEALNWLAFNEPGKPAYTLFHASRPYVSVAALFEAFAAEGLRVEVVEVSALANLGDLWLEERGALREVLAPVYVDTGRRLPSGRPLVVPLTHRHLEVSVRGRLNLDLQFYLGVDGLAGFRPLATADQSWIGRGTGARVEGREAAALLERAAWARRELAAKAKASGLPASGLGPLGVCNDLHAFVTGRSPYPMVRDPSRFRGASRLDRASKSLPYDVERPADLRRILDSIPPSVPEAAGSEGLAELRSLFASALR